jgi:hypothetical protein
MTREVKRTEGLGGGPERYIAVSVRRYSRLRIAGSADGGRRGPEKDRHGLITGGIDAVGG